MNFFKKSLSLAGLFLSLMSSASADNQYGLKDNIQDGVILHCFDWTAAQIEAEITNIAEAGFSAVQLSPVHQREGASAWYMAYQPYDFYIGNSIATTESLTSLCTAAHNVGVKVIVDVIANHTNGNLQYVADRLKVSSLYHNDPTTLNDIDYSSRYSITHDDMGIQDLATETEAVQTIIKAYIAELKACGVDGIRFDAAKHIGLPSEGDNFWANVPDKAMYNYGEILDSTGGDDTKLFPEYQKYISITDNNYGNGLASSFSSGNVPSSIGAFNQRGASSAKLVYWGESHDTYSNDNGESKYKSQNSIDRAYAIAAGNNGATALYFSRPSETQKDKIKMGVKGSTHFTSPEVAEVNHCHNLCAGEPNYYVHASQVGAQVRNSGCIMATGNGQAQDVSFANGDGKGGWLTPGTYTDKVAGGQFTVTTSTISGHVGSTGIAVIYNAVAPPPITPYIPSVTTDEISCFLETTAASVSIWVWDATNKTNYTGGVWATKPNMELMGVNAEGKNIFKWTYDGELTAIPEKVIFVPDGAQTADLNFTNHGYYIGSAVDHVVSPSETPVATYALVCADATAKQGETVTLSLNLTTENLSPVGLQCLITLPEGVTSGDDGLTNLQASADRTNGHTIQSSRTQTGYALTLLDEANAALKGNSGAIASFDVVVSSTATLGDLLVSVSDLTLTAIGADNEVETYYESDAVSSTLTVRQADDDYIELVDGVPYTNAENKAYSEIRYSRIFKNTSWQALVLPFSLDYEDWKDNFDIAKIYNIIVTESDATNLSKAKIQYVLLKEDDVTVPNVPYVIRAKVADSVNPQSLINTDCTLYAASPQTVECSNTEMSFKFHGTYSGLTKEEMNGYFGLGGGSWNYQTGAYALAPYRIYLEVVSKTGGYNANGYEGASIRGELIDENESGEENSIEVVSSEECSNAIVIERQLIGLQPGVYQMKGKTVIVK